MRTKEVHILQHYVDILDSPFFFFFFFTVLKNGIFSKCKEQGNVHTD